MTFEPELIEPKPLTAMGAVRASYAVFWSNRILFLKTALPAVVLLSLSAFFLPVPSFPSHTHLASPGDTDATIANSEHFGMASFAFGIAAWLLVTSFKVSWQRFLILGDKPSVIYFGFPFWSYIGTSILLILAFMGWLLLSYLPLIILIVIAGVVSSLSHASGWMIAIGLILYVGSFIPSFIWFTRRVLVFPARALGNEDMTWKQSAEVMRGHVWTYLCASFVAIVPFTIPSILAIIILYTIPQPAYPILAFVMQGIQQFFAFACGGVIASVLTYFYIALIEDKPLA